MKRLLKFIDDRLPVSRSIRHFLEEPLPLNVGWAHVFGSALLFLLILQFVTGGALLMFFAPTPQHAWDSLNHLITSVSSGALLHGLHAWGSSLIMILMTLHILRVVFHGSYKKPRELNWISGMLAFLLILGFAFTGYLLPWDQKGYWGTQVGTEMIAKTPLVGPLLASILKGGTDLGAYTLSRFFALHVFFLPALLVGVVVIHLVLLRRHGIADHPETEKRSPTRLAFYPFQLYKDSVASAGLLLLLVLLSLFVPVGLEDRADPADGSYDPRPEWYFLAHYELLRLFSAWEIIPIVIIPTLILGGLFLLPFWDRGPARQWAARRLPVVLVFGLFASMYGAVVYSRVAHPAGGVMPAEESLPLPESDTPEVMLQGRHAFVVHKCGNCHQLRGVGGLQGPDLSQTGWKFSPQHLRQQILNPRANTPDSKMPAYEGEISEQDLEAVVQYLSQML